MDHFRRLLPRQFTNWHGKYPFEEESEPRWRNCRVLDVSSAGAGLELLESFSLDSLAELQAAW